MAIYEHPNGYTQANGRMYRCCAKNGHGDTCTYTNRDALETARHIWDNHRAVITSKQFPDVIAYLGLVTPATAQQLKTARAGVNGVKFDGTFVAPPPVATWLANVVRYSSHSSASSILMN